MCSAPHLEWQVKNMRFTVIFISTIFTIGAILWLVGISMPIYTDPRAPERLSHDLQDRPRDDRFQEWYSGLRSVETPHKILTDKGRGLMALALGVILAVSITSFYQRYSGLFRIAFVITAWLSLWALKIPFSAWYYWLRQKRFDYPSWGDSIAIPIMSDTVTWIVGAVISSLALFALMVRYQFGTTLRPIRPIGAWAWIRAVLLGGWLLLILVCAASGIWDGDEGMVISCLGAIPLLLAVLAARPSLIPSTHESIIIEPTKV